MYRTLTADDNPNVLLTMDELLGKIDPEGEHLFACDGKEALSLTKSNPVDVAFLDVEMPELDGLETAKRITESSPNTNIVFITGYTEYAARAFELYASGYLVKPVTEEKLRSAFAHLRFAPHRLARRLKVKCFGTFEVRCDDEPVRFARSNTMALFAYLIDRNGELCDKQRIINAVWPEEADNLTFCNQVRVFLSDLHTTLIRLGMGDALVRSNGLVGVNRPLIDCDYYQYLDGDGEAKKLFRGEYMSQYSFGEYTLAELRKNSAPQA